jgi:hypothetical protein
MDITLERIFSLLPHKPDGRLVRGSKAELARSLGYDSGDIVTMWVNGSSASYKKRLSDIALMYNVSVEWLKGETDDPRPGYVMTDYGSMPDVQLIARAGERMNPEQRQSLLRYIRYMFPEAFDDQEQGK